MPDNDEIKDLANQQYFKFGSVEPSRELEFAATDSPSAQDDLRFVRPYFVVPILDRDESEVDADEALADATRRISAKLKGLDKPVTDVYIVSHGWHRNIYSAVAAYDRLMSRFATLVRRGRIDPGEGWNPLFLTLHWHSDLGKNDWVDQAGRRDKASFLRNVFGRLEPRALVIDPGTMKTQFEELFEFFVKVCAPEIDPFAEGIEKDSKRLGKILENYTIQDARTANHEEVISAAWTCYHEAEITKSVMEQDEGPGEFTRPFAYLSGVLRIIVSVVGLTAVLGFVLRNKWVGDRWEVFENWVEATIAGFWPGILSLAIPWRTAVFAGLFYVLAWMVIGVVTILYRGRQDGEPLDVEPGIALDPRRRRKRRAKGLKTSGTIAWAMLQVVHSIPILAYCLLTPLFASAFIQAIFVAMMLYIAQTHTWVYAIAVVSLMMFAFSRFQYQERSMKVGEGANRGFVANTFRAVVSLIGLVRRILVRLARFPIKAISNVASSDDRVLPVWKAVDNQFVFWDMVKKAVDSSECASDWFSKLADSHPDKLNESTKIHIFGHSHGGLLVMNLGRLMAYRRTETQPTLQTVSTICGAFMSGWLRGEPQYIDRVKGCITCVYSRYDVANSFWYPLANLGRKAAGYVGLWLGSPLPDTRIGEPLPFASIASTPNLAKRVVSVGQNPKTTKVLNIDGSRLIFEGPVIPQGSHGDIFKDDIVQLLWSTTQFEKDRASIP
ncbi:MAG: hypothetical protein H7Y17_05505 [Chlorobia bacterium]|nr:hypothetical protein [Fimbriimonadaceae bacterium]